jgi:hypothetical protein
VTFIRTNYFVKRNRKRKKVNVILFFFLTSVYHWCQKAKMVENLTLNREWSLINNDTNDHNGHVHHSRFLARKISDHNNNNNNQHHQSTSDYNDIPSLAAIRTPKPLSNQLSLDASYDTDGAVGTSGNRSKHHQNSNNNYDYLISPRLSVRRHGGQSSKLIATIPLQQRLPHKMHLAANATLNDSQNHDDRDEDTNYESDSRRRHIRLSRRVHQPLIASGNHGARAVHTSALVHHTSPLVAAPSVLPLRIIFMRHSERANQALGPDWFNKAFRTNTYKAYDQNLPFILPKRRFDQAYEFDVPLTGQKNCSSSFGNFSIYMIYFSSWFKICSSYWTCYDE